MLLQVQVQFMQFILIYFMQPMGMYIIIPSKIILPIIILRHPLLTFMHYIIILTMQVIMDLVM